MFRTAFICFLFLPLAAFAQKADSSRTDSTRSDSAASDSVLAPVPPNPYPSLRLDTIFFGQIYQNTPLEYPFRPGLGNLGLDAYSLIPKVQGNARIGHRPGLPRNPYTYPHGRPITFDVRYPVTRLEYSFGSGEEQFFNITHTQNITPRWNFGIRYRKFGSPGPYPRQRTNSGNFLFTTQYREAQGYYQIRASYQGSRSTLQQNGGILDPNVFENNEQENRAAYRTRLDEAQSEPRSDEVRLDHAFFPTGRSFDTSRIQDASKKLGFFHQTRASNVLLRYKDQNPLDTLYQYAHLDTVETRDSTRFKAVEQTAGVLLQRIEGREISGELRFGFRYELIRNSMLTRSVGLKDAALLLKGYWSFDEHRLGGKLSYGTAGYGEGDRVLRADWSFPWKARALGDSLGVELLYKDRTPAYLFQNYRSNHFIWDRALPSVTTLHARARWGDPRREEGIALSHTRKWNAVYFDRSARPASADQELRFFRIHARKEFRWRKWGLDLEAAYQREWNTELIRIPEYLGRGELFFETPLFNKALNARFGARVTYYAAYKGYAYMPATRRFYLQDDPVTGDHPFIDVFFQGRVSKIQFFVELDHGNAGLMGYRYFGAPHYPLRDRMIRAGIKWNIYN